ncbi:MAG: sialate O-acetylesterase [Kiritimatiellae bacterium]|nr:sialate O-acetylesterase [Kiritimatiellia bacterium]
MGNLRQCWIVAGVLGACLSVGHADVRLPLIFGDHAVLQRDKPIPIWGWASPAEKVKVSLDGVSTQAVADAAGNWRVDLPARAAGGALELRVEGSNTLVRQDLVMGDVWVCSGQSNMEMPLVGWGTWEGEQDAAAANFPLIRAIKAQHVQSGDRQADLPAGATWRVCAAATAGGFSAVGFHFARDIHQRTQVPIGLIDCSWSGAPIEPFLAAEGLRKVPEINGPFEASLLAYRQSLASRLAEIEQWLTAAKAAVKAGELPSADIGKLPSMPLLQAAPPGMFNAMVHPCTRYPVRGFLWYQGCSNGSEGESYLHKMRALVAGWRALWGDDALPFYFVQLANFTADNNNPAGGDGYANLRMAQFDSLRQIPGSGMAVTIDIGMTGDIHPKNKTDVGQRLARWARRDVYGEKDLVVSGPCYQRMEIENGAIRLHFDHVGKGLMVGRKDKLLPVEPDPDKPLARFAIAGEDKVWVWADAKIDGNTVVVSHATVAKPVAVRYAFSANPLGANLYNTEGLPASPFRTDRW